MKSELTTLRSKLLCYNERVLFLGSLVAAAILVTAGIRAGLTAQEAETNISSSFAEDGSSQDGKVIPNGAISGTYLTKIRPYGTSGVIGVLNIPALNLTAPIISGIENRDLARGLGHVPGSATAGGLGNMAVAGHRDTYFRPLRRVAKGMFVFVTAASNRSYRYQIDSAEIVSPDHLQVLDIGTTPELTMITCYPFNFIGAAPRRFVVHAHLVSADPEPVQP